MAVTSNRSIATTMTGDILFSRSDAAAESAAAPGVVEKKDLSSGNNAITVPSGAKGLTIKPPTGNAQTLTLKKGVNADTGVAIHKTDPTSLGLETGATVVLNAGGSVTGVVLVWT